VLRAVFQCYLLPLMAVLAAAAGGMALGGEPGSVMGAAVGLAVGWLAMRRAGRREPVLAMRLKDAVVYMQRNRQT
jgi:positive regulator of sigma E activity